MSDAMKALARLTEWPGLIDDGRPDDERVECHLLAGDLRLLYSLLPTLRVALAPGADGEVGSTHSGSKPVNTNDLRDYADRISNPYAQFILDTASQLDHARTDRNLARAEIARLSAELSAVKEELSTWCSVFPDIAPSSVLPDRSKLEAELAAERERRVEVEGALKPFAAMVSNHPEMDAPSPVITLTYNKAHLRRAATLTKD